MKGLAFTMHSHQMFIVWHAQVNSYLKDLVATRVAALTKLAYISYQCSMYIDRPTQDLSQTASSVKKFRRNNCFWDLRLPPQKQKGRGPKVKDVGEITR